MLLTQNTQTRMYYHVAVQPEHVKHSTLAPLTPLTQATPVAGRRRHHPIPMTKSLAQPENEVRISGSTCRMPNPFSTLTPLTTPSPPHTRYVLHIHTSQLRTTCLYSPIFRPRIHGRPGVRPDSATPEPRAQSAKAQIPGKDRRLCLCRRQAPRRSLLALQGSIEHHNRGTRHTHNVTATQPPTARPWASRPLRRHLAALHVTERWIPLPRVER